MQWSSISGIGNAVDDEHPHVIRLTVDRGKYERALIALLDRTPSLVKNTIRYFWPGLFLPPRIIIKKKKKGWEEEFETERAAYAKLKPAQGYLVPVFCGEVTCEGSQALVLSEVDGTMPFEQKEPLDRAEFKKRLTQACQELATFGLFPGDIKLANILLVGDGVVFLDLEFFYEVEPELREMVLGQTVSAFMTEYWRYQESISGRSFRCK